MLAEKQQKIKMKSKGSPGQADGDLDCRVECQQVWKVSAKSAVDALHVLVQPVCLSLLFLRFFFFHSRRFLSSLILFLFNFCASSS